MKAKSLFIVLFIILLNSCSLFEADTNKDKNITVDEKSAKVIKASNEFGLELFQKINAASKEENLMISPLSVSVALAMAYNGADGDTKTEMEKVLKVSGLTVDQINASYKYLISALQSLDDSVTFEIANAIFYRQGFPFKSPFIETNKEVYDAEVTGLDFAKQASVDVINKWVSDKTREKIPTIIEQLNPLDVMILLNAVYFNGIWSVKFDEKGTHDLPFNKTSGTVEVPMMNKEDKVDYTKNNLFSAVKLPYGTGQYNMVIYLPADGKTSQDVIDNLSAANWANWLGGFETTDHVVITMPRFKYSFEAGLNGILAQMGMLKAFSETAADFSKISDMDLYISAVKHKSYIDVNENGTEAAAVTSITFTTTSIGPAEPPKTYFTVNKPFVYAITEKDTEAILFIGEVTNPIYE